MAALSAIFSLTAISIDTEDKRDRFIRLLEKAIEVNDTEDKRDRFIRLLEKAIEVNREAAGGIADFPDTWKL